MFNISTTNVTTTEDAAVSTDHQLPSSQNEKKVIHNTTFNKSTLTVNTKSYRYYLQVLTKKMILIPTLNLYHCCCHLNMEKKREQTLR